MRRLIVALLAPLAVAGCGGDGGTDTPAGPAWDLAFAGEVGGTTVLMRTRGATREVRRLGLGYPGITPAFEPSGARVLFTTVGTQADPPHLAWLDSATAEPRRFSDDVGVPEREADWSPAGDRVAYTSYRDDSYGDVFVAIVAQGTMLSTRNATVGHGADGVPDITPSWSPDGARIAFTSYRSGSPAVYVMNSDGSNPRRLTTPENAGDYFPTWSPAGDSIAFQRLDGMSARIGLVAAAGGTPRFLTLPGDAYSPEWAPDGARLAITMDVGNGDLDVHVVGTDGTIVERIRREGRDYQPRWVRRESRF